MDLTDSPSRTARRRLAALLLLGSSVLAVNRYVNSDRFESALCWWDHDTIRYFMATQTLFQRNRADHLGIEWDGPGWHEADADQERAARAVPRWVRRHIDSHVHRQLGWNDQTGWAQ